MLTRPNEAGQVTFSSEDSKKDDGITTIIGGMVGSAVLPFGSGTVALGDDDGTMPTVMKPSASELSSRERSPWAAPPNTALPSEDDGTGTIVGSLMLGQVLPFAESPKRLADVMPIPPPTLIHTPPFVSSEPAPERHLKPEVISSTTPAPPAMIGPLMVIGDLAIESPARAPAHDSEANPVPDAIILSSATEPDTTVAVDDPTQAEVELSIERFAAISAEIVEGRAARSEVLHNHDLTHRAWLANERRWTNAIEDEAADGSSRLRSANDRAYVEAVEGFRGPVMLDEYAQVVVGLERGGANHVLDNLAIQRPALMPILRVWTKKVAGDARLADEARTLLARMRDS